MSEIAEKKFPYDTEKECKDEFTRNLRNGIIDLLRQTFDLGMEYKEKEMMKDAISGTIFGSRYFRQKNVSLTNLSEEQYDKLKDFGERVKVIIIEE